MDILRLPDVLKKTGYRSPTSIYDAVRSGTFTRPVKLGVRAVGWPNHEVDKLLAARVAGCSEEDIRTIVQALHDSRSHESLV